MKAMILAAGFGTRLFPLTIDRTKPAIPFLGKPLVGYVAEYVARFGFKEFIVNLHHQPESVREALGDGSEFGVHITYTLEEPNILGTAGALDNAKDLLKDEPFLIVNGKIISDIDIAAAPLLSGKTQVRRITLVGVQLSLVHMKKGGVRLGAEGDKNGNDVLKRLNDVIEASGSSTSGLQSFAVRNARIALFDETTGLSIVAPRPDAVGFRWTT